MFGTQIRVSQNNVLNEIERARDRLEDTLKQMTGTISVVSVFISLLFPLLLYGWVVLCCFSPAQASGAALFVGIFSSCALVFNMVLALVSDTLLCYFAMLCRPVLCCALLRHPVSCYGVSSH